MRKHRVCLHVTLHKDSATLSYFVEHNDGEGRWELWSDGESLPLSAVSVACAEFQDSVSEAMAGWYASTKASSDLA